MCATWQDGETSVPGFGQGMAWRLHDFAAANRQCNKLRKDLRMIFGIYNHVAADSFFGFPLYSLTPRSNLLFFRKAATVNKIDVVLVLAVRTNAT